MSPSWDDVNVRARGLGTHLLTRGELESLARQPDIASLAAAMGRHALLPGVEAGAAEPAALELGVRRWAAGALRILARWTGKRSDALPLVFDDEDRRSLRAIFRGAGQRVPAEARLAGLIPTPALPERALLELAGAPTIAAVGALLSAWRHPFAPVVAVTTAEGRPDLFALEVALARAAAERATVAARRSGSRAVHELVQESIDLENGSTALVLAAGGRDIVVGELFLPGGTRVSRELFEAAVATRAPAAAGLRIAAAFAGSPWARVFAGGAGDPVALETELLRIRLRALTRRVRQAPLDAATTVWYALRLRAQVLDLQRIIWTVALDAPRQVLVDRLTTAAA